MKKRKYQEIVYKLHFSGIYGRKRKINVYYEEILRKPLDKPANENKLKKLVDDELKKIKARNGNWYVEEDVELIEKDEKMGITRRFRPLMVGYGSSLMCGEI
jgi:hypothetical protein